MNPKRGEIWWVNLNPTRGREIKKHRPCVIVSARKLRREYPGAMHRVINRGNQREDIFREDVDRLRVG